MKTDWIEYSKKKPTIGQQVLCYRDIESKQKFVTIWSEEEELYADWNNITFWMPVSDPVTQAE